MTVSVIVPTFNAAASLRTCIESILAQTYAPLEVLVVNDGSDDETEEIAAALVAEDLRVRVFNQMNSGVSVARNNGLATARGEFVLFVDSDDWLEPSCLAELVHVASKNDADMVGFSYFVDSEIQTQASSYRTGGSISPSNAVASVLRTQNRFAWTWLYRRSTVGQVQFRPDIRWGEDTLFVCDVLTRCEHVSFIDMPLYHYVQSSGSATRSGLNPAKVTGVLATRELLRLLKRAFPEHLVDGHAYRIMVLCELVVDLRAAGRLRSRLGVQTRGLLVLSGLRVAVGAPIRLLRSAVAAMVAAMAPAAYIKIRSRSLVEGE